MANESAAERLKAAALWHAVSLDDALREVAALEAERADTRYEVGIMSAITGRQDDETLTEAVTRVCHQLAALTAELQACYGDQCRWCGDGLRVERRMGPEINGWSWPFWIHCEEGEPRGIGCRAFTARERAYQREQAATASKANQQDARQGR